jgi:hypothetical protein
MFFTELATLLQRSVATINSHYRPPKQEVRERWARELDIRERDDGALHCDTERALALRDRLLAETLEGPLAFGPSRLAAPVRKPEESNG